MNEKGWRFLGSIRFRFARLFVIKIDRILWDKENVVVTVQRDTGRVDLTFRDARTLATKWEQQGAKTRVL